MLDRIKKIFLVAVMLITGLVVVQPMNVSAYDSDKDSAADNELLTNPEYLDLIRAVIEGELNHGLSGAQLAVYKDGALVIDEAFGYTNNFYNTYNTDGSVNFDGAKALPKNERTPVTSDTLFDMASNTKMYAAVFAMQKIVDEGLVTLDTLVKDIFPEFTDYANENGWKDVITVEHVLSHYAGFAPDPQYHNNNYDLDDGIPNGVNDLYSQDKATTFEMIMKTPITTQPGTAWAYSDVDMMMAGFIVEHFTGKDLDTYVKETFYQPLGLDRITFNPLRNGFTPEETSSAEVHGNTRDGRINFNNVRETVVTGEVHDEKAFYAMDGISGHAGLFGTAKQVAYLAQVMLDGTLNGQTFFSQDTIDDFTETAALTTQARGGWRRRNSGTGAGAWFSYFSPEGTIGHTGWTGTVTFIDPVNNITVALFTNRTNTPIHGPGANDFWTANSNVTSYTAISEFVYQALGLGNGQSVDSTITNMIAVEIGYGSGAYIYPTQERINNYTPAKRNVIRALLATLDDLDANFRTLDTSRDPQFRNRVADTLRFLEETKNSDLHFLLVTKPLDEALDSYAAKDTTIYTDASVAAVEALVEEAETLLAGTPSQDAVDTLYTQLQDAIDGLELRVIKDELEALITSAEALTASDYTVDSYAILEDALAAGRSVLLDDEATQDAVDTAIENLKLAQEGLVNVVNKKALEDLIKDAEKISSAKFTKASFEALTTSLNAAKSVFNDPDANQEKVNQAVSSLQAALDALIPSDAGTLPNSGVTSNNTFAISLVLVSLGLVSIVYGKYRKREHE